MRVAELILDVLVAHGVRHVFGIPGDAINDLTHAISKRDDIEFVLVRHEEAGAFMAAAQAKLTGRLTACVGTAGPGAIHLLNGLYDAKQDHAPVIAITGQAGTEHIGTSYHQEVNLERLFSDVAEYSQTVMSEDQLPALMLEACKAATSKSGIAHISIPTDVAGRNVNPKRKDFALGSGFGEMQPCRESLDQACKLIDKANKITILAGIGAHNAREELLELSERLKAPIVRTLRAKDVLDECEDACVGGTGLLGSTAGSEAMEGCDLLLMVGTDLPYTEFYPKNAEVIQIETDPGRMGRRVALSVPLYGHAKPTLAMLLAEVAQKESDDFYVEIQGKKREERNRLAKSELSDAHPIKPQRAVAELNRIVPDDTIFVCDTGTTTAWTARHLQIGDKQRYTLSSSLASMGFALPGAIGAQLAYPDRPVVAITGDGGFAMLMSDFVTAVARDLPITVVIFNNNELSFIGLEQEAKGYAKHAIDLINPDFCAIAEACGGKGIRVEKADDLERAYRDALASACPTVVDVKVDADEIIMPPKVTADQAIKFGLAKVKGALSE